MASPYQEHQPVEKTVFDRVDHALLPPSDATSVLGSPEAT